MRAISESEMRAGVRPLDVVRPWVREDLRVPISGVVEQVDPLARLDADAADLSVREHGAQEPAGRRSPAQRLLDRPVEQAGIRLELLKLIRMPGERESHPGEKRSCRITARREKRAAVGEQIRF